MFYKHDQIQNKELYPMIKIQKQDSLKDNLIYTFQ